jgi:diguanylate cyclase (GGDEF)-like protein
MIAYAGLDYSLDSLLETRRIFIIRTTCLLTILAAFTAYVVIKLVDRSIVHPINALSEASVQYKVDNADGNHDTHRFSDLQIQTGDEIETLADSMAQMEKDINDYITNLLSTKNELKDTKKYAEKMERNAYKDSLTGVRNKRAYDEVIVGLNKDMAENDVEFGLAVIDLNNLKMINDLLGHECGDVAIIQLCRTICDVFSHSPVFRYGGDEFVVILRNRDLDNIDALVERFHNIPEEYKGDKKDVLWFRYGAAIGYAIYNPAIDDDTSSVFDRADKAMYKDKQRTKSNQENNS